MDRIIHPIRVYADTSVFGGVFDSEFSTASKRFFDQVRNGRFELVISTLLEDELAPAPIAVQDLLSSCASSQHPLRSVPMPGDCEMHILGREF